MELIKNLPPKSNVLFVSNGCGGGHIQAVNSLESQLVALHPQVKSTTIDIYKNSFCQCIGNRVIERWNRHQKEGDIAALNAYLKCRWVERYILSICVFFSFVVTLLKNNVDIVINVQPFGQGAMLSAIHVVNFIRKYFCCQRREPIKIHMVLTELPTSDTKNYFQTIKALWSCHLSRFTLHTTQPLLEPGQTEENFWKSQCGLPMKNVKYDALPIRQPFFDQRDKPCPHSLRILVNSPETRQVISDCSKANPYANERDYLVFDLDPHDRLLSIHLGGQACVSAVKDYLLSRIQDQTPRTSKEYVFIMCGADTSETSLFAQVVDIAKKTPIPDKLHIVPLPYQRDCEIAPILARSDAAIIKSGGLTSMEVFTVSPRRILIHAMSSNATQEEEIIQRGMPIWEGGNAKYLQAKKGARIITPATLGDVYL